MLGGGNPVGGANPSGISSNLNTIGNHVYANSGPITVTSGSYTTGLSFSNPTGNKYVIAELYVNSADSTSSDLFYQVELDGQVINNQIINENKASVFLPFTFLIPPYSKVVVSGMRGSGSDFITYFNIIGEIH